jgi:aminopeptidase N
VQSYIQRFQYQAITTADFRAAFEDAFDPQRTGAVASAADATLPPTAIDWQAWLHAPGMPPVDISARRVLRMRDARFGCVLSAADALACWRAQL